MIAAFLAVAIGAAPVDAPKAATPKPTPISGVTVLPAPTVKPKPNDAMVCEDEAPIGTKLKRTVCLPRTYVESRTREAQKTIDRMTTGGPVLDPTR
ncbi:hypothetical protein [Phenylobacterium sp.]|uniref:hypothetical protein n=1 Tax=Phenylobacterium sp. TaxID=1871053 RepID=UPI002DE4D8F8|nr:hypothetical protein [Phenylobacterium sp.]